MDNYKSFWELEKNKKYLIKTVIKGFIICCICIYILQRQNGDIMELKQLMELRRLKITEIEVYSVKGKLNKELHKKLKTELKQINKKIKIEEDNYYKQVE